MELLKAYVAHELIFMVLTLFILFYHALTFFLYLSLRYLYKEVWQGKELKMQVRKDRVCVIIAHPDDETMFFGPTILRIVKKVPVYVLCLSQGNFDGKGLVRKSELWQSCQKLGIPPENITILKHDKLLDGPRVDWPLGHLSAVIYNHAQAYGINKVFTFDEGGVSGHANHVAVFRAIIDLMDKSKWPVGCRVFVLDSVNVLRKYIAIFDVPICYLFNRNVFIVSGQLKALISSAMKCHRSQLVWYRRCYMLFSRYTMINTYREIPYKNALSSEDDDNNSYSSLSPLNPKRFPSTEEGQRVKEE